MVKFTILLKRRATLAQDEFVHHHKAVHARLFMSVAAGRQTVRRTVQQHAVSTETVIAA